MTAYSNSQLQSYKNCPLQYRFYWDLKLRKLDDEAGEHHLRFGHAFHEGLAVLYGANYMEQLTKTTWARAENAVQTGYPTQLDIADKAKTQENALATLASYVRRWQQEDLAKWKVLEIETRSDDPWSVKPDVVLEDREHGGIYLMDHKTTGAYLNYQYWERFQPNSQITHYLDYAQSKWGPIEGFIINAISFRYRERAYKGEPAGFWCAFERQMFNRRPEQLEYERLSRADWIASIERSHTSGFWRTNTDSCRFCQYKPICQPGWTWEDDRELIEIQFYQCCDTLLDNDDHCVLALDHEGKCSPLRPEQQPTEITIEV